MNRLREAREYIGFSHTEVAAILGVDTRTIAGFEAENIRPTEYELSRLSRLYQRPVPWLQGKPVKPVEISPELDG